MKIKLAAVAAVLTLATLSLTGCSGLSSWFGFFWGDHPETASTTTNPPTTVVGVAPTLPPTTSSTTTSTVRQWTTTTTLSPRETYRAAMKVWADTYGPRLSQAYSVMSGTNFASPTPTQIQAAKDLDVAMSAMVADLQSIKASPDLAAAHTGFLTSLQKMAVGVHDLSQAMQQGQTLQSYSAVATIASAWQQGESARTTLEQALGFSLSG